MISTMHSPLIQHRRQTVLQRAYGHLANWFPFRNDSVSKLVLHGDRQEVKPNVSVSLQ
jgi:hypothetical protein